MKFLKVCLTGIFGFGMLMFLLVMCASTEEKPSANQPKKTTTSPKVVARSRSNKVAVAPSRPDKVDWNLKDPDALTNSNIPLAVEYIKSRNSANVGTAFKNLGKPSKTQRCKFLEQSLL